MRRFDVVYQREETGWWVAQVKQAPAAVTRGRTLAEARRRIRTALELALGSERAARQAALIDDLRLPGAARRAIRAVAVSRARLDQARRDLSEATDAAIGELVDGMKLSVRDAGELLGLSHQRVQQLRAAASPRGTGRHRRGGRSGGKRTRPRTPATVHRRE